MYPKATRTKMLIFLALLALSMSAAVPSYSADGGTILDGEGRILRLHNGLFSEFFPGSPAIAGENRVLVLETIQPNGRSSLQLVPGTETSDIEDWETLIYEPSSNTTYLLWQDLYSHIHPRLLLTSYDGDDWQDVIEIWSSAFDRKGSPDLVVTREDGQARKPEAEETDRTIVHLTWWQEAPATSRKLYAPVILENGHYIGWTPLFDLGALVPVEDGYTPSVVQPEMADAIRIQRGKDNHSIVIGFLHPKSHRLITLEIDVLPQELAKLANKARAQIIEMGAFSLTPVDLAQQIYDALFHSGGSFHDASLEYIASLIRDEIDRSTGNGVSIDLEDMAHKARAQIIEMGSRMTTGGLADARESQILEVGAAPSGTEPRHLFKVTVLSDREPPETDGRVELYLSESGADLLVAWEDSATGRIYYQQSNGPEWHEVAYIEPTEALDRAAIHELLRQRLR